MLEEDRLKLIEDQQRYEALAVERGVERYRQHLRDAREQGTEADTPPGMRMMAAVMTELVPAVEAGQAEALEATTKAGEPRAWHFPLLSLSAEKWALITARTCLSAKLEHRLCSTMAFAIARRGRDEREFEMFLDQQRQAIKDGRKEGKPVSTFMQTMIRRAEMLAPKQAKAFMKRAAAKDKLDWDKPQRAALGMYLIHLLVTNGGGWFEIQSVGSTMRGTYTTSNYVALTEATKLYLEYHHAQSELTRPWQLPMLCPPNPWRIS